ncbi:galactarate dehydratase [Pseudovibrio flavus]|uniref:galactarate dehydratase n=1 Tax=Pseudovibrio flavus TaxID=2529854 RepID=UPI00211D0BB9|nr:galactarate dehydratase [Pseudovibrio flavus]
MTCPSKTTIKVHQNDNTAIVIIEGGLKEGQPANELTTAQETIPFGHKVALTDIPKGGAIIRYNEVLGYACEPIAKGRWINEHMIELPVAPELSDLPLATRKFDEPEPLEGYTFEGYRNADGSVGTKNLLAISSSVQCVAGLTNILAEKIRKELLPLFPNVDGVVALNHAYGCGVAINAPAAVVPIRALQNLTLNPNFGGEVMIIGLGCEKLDPNRLVPCEEAGACDASVISMQEERFTGFAQMLDAMMETAKRHLEKLNARQRTTCPVADLVVGLQCGGSDAFSGITANPALGFAADLIVRAGGAAMFSEVTEVRDAIHLLTPRAADKEVGKALLREMEWYDDYLANGRTDRAANPSPGNKKGGLANVVEKSLGSIAKSGTSPIIDVLSHGERIRKKGMTFAATPASDFVCGTMQLCAGMNIQVFTTGRGTPYNLEAAPVIKVSTNTALAKRWFDLIDYDAGRIATDTLSIEDAGWELFHLILDVASGRKQTCADKLGLRNDLAVFNPAPIT